MKESIQTLTLLFQINRTGPDEPGNQVQPGHGLANQTPPFRQNVVHVFNTYPTQNANPHQDQPVQHYQAPSTQNPIQTTAVIHGHPSPVVYHVPAGSHVDTNGNGIQPKPHFPIAQQPPQTKPVPTITLPQPAELNQTNQTENLTTVQPDQDTHSTEANQESQSEPRSSNQETFPSSDSPTNESPSNDTHLNKNVYQ